MTLNFVRRTKFIPKESHGKIRKGFSQFCEVIPDFLIKKSGIVRKFILALSLVLMSAALEASGSLPLNEPLVRVLILEDVKDVACSIKGSYQIMNPATEEVLKEGKHLKKLAIAMSPEGISLDETVYPIDRLRITTEKSIIIHRNQKDYAYRGTFDFIRKGPETTLIVNSINLENYVRGVLYHEITDRWPIEAMKAQAVAVRSYALYQIQKSKNQPFDVRSNAYSQVYGGKSAEHYRTNLAVKRTQYQYLMFEGNILPTYYHSVCGGHTENATELWNHDLAPLRGVVCSFCEYSPLYQWRKNFRLKDIQDKLNAKGHRFGMIQEIVVKEKTSSGRAKTLEIKTRDGKRKNISAKDFREAIGSNDVKSNFYDIEMKGYFLDLVGHGWGHGVGLCQWGAYGMAKKHFTYEEILQFYYPQASLVRYQ